MNNSHIKLEFHEFLPAEEVSELELEISHENLLFEAKKKEVELTACSEWAIPGLIAAYILRHYFESFLQEAGKDHYGQLKNWLKSLLKKSKHIPSFVKSHDPKNTQSMAVSIHIQLKGLFWLKLRFDKELSIIEWQEAMDSAMVTLGEYYWEDKGMLHECISRQTLRGGEIYGIISKQSKQWIFVSDVELAWINSASTSP